MPTFSPGERVLLENQREILSALANIGTVPDHNRERLHKRVRVADGMLAQFHGQSLETTAKTLFMGWTPDQWRVAGAWFDRQWSSQAYATHDLDGIAHAMTGRCYNEAIEVHRAWRAHNGEAPA